MGLHQEHGKKKRTHDPNCVDKTCKTVIPSMCIMMSAIPAIPASMLVLNTFKNIFGATPGRLVAPLNTLLMWRIVMEVGGVELEAYYI